MRGQFDITKFDARGIPDEVFQEARRLGTVQALLKGLPVRQQCKAISNRLFDNLAAYWFRRLFGGASIPAPYEDVGAPPAALGFITLLTLDSEPAYTDATNEGVNSIHNVANSANTSTAGKRFIEDQSKSEVITVDPSATGREDFTFTDQWLYAPSEGISTNIRSIGAYFSSDADQPATINRGIIGRVRLKDQAGNNTILHKGSDEALLVSYTIGLVSN
jgi:hypothetical protein